MITEFHKAGLKTMCYFEAFGTATSFIAELDRKLSDYTTVRVTHWSWQYYGGGRIAWIGPQNYFDCEDFAGIYTRKHPRYGGRAMTYPDGTIATGYFDDNPMDPRNSRVLDAGISKCILGYDLVEPDFNPAAEAAGVLNGLIAVTANGRERAAGHLSFHKDTACPMWADLQHASVLYAADKGMDGIWADNFSPWDNFGYPPVQKAFGDWSVARFRDYLKKQFSSTQLTAMGVTNVSTFDIRTPLRSQCKAWGGNDTNLDDPVWNDVRWLNHPLWRAYKIYKRQIGTEGLRNYYNAAKEAGKAAGNPDFFVSGNDIPFFGLGFPRGDLDMVSTEMSAGWHMGTSARGVMYPPQGRFAPIYKLAREHAKSRFVNVWFYIPDAKYQGKPGIANVLEYEMLATHALPMLFPAIQEKQATIKPTPPSFNSSRTARPPLGRACRLKRSAYTIRPLRFWPS